MPGGVEVPESKSSSSTLPTGEEEEQQQQVPHPPPTVFSQIKPPDFDQDDDEDDEDQETYQDQLNISMESDRLDPEVKAAHEADTLPMDGPAPPQAPLQKKRKGGGDSQSSSGNAAATSSSRSRILLQKVHSLAGPVLASEHPLRDDAPAKDRFLQSLRCPPHGTIATLMTLTLLPLLLWTVSLSMFGPSVAAAPNGTLFLLIVLVVVGMVLGHLFSLIRLPNLLGMLLWGIILKNLPGIEFDSSWQSWSSTLRGMALVIILMRAGLGLDPEALKRLSGMVFRLAFLPCLGETLVVAIASNLLLGFPWLWGFMLGFVLAAVSPAVVVPCLLQLQERGLGVAKGIPTLVIAAASVDDVLAISGFTILLGITFKPDADLVAIIFQGPLEAFVGLAFGAVWGLLVTFLPAKDTANFHGLRFIFLFGGGLLALFGSQMIEFPGSGALAVLVMAFVAGIGWRKQGWVNDEDNTVAQTLAKMWVIFQPILFGLIGTEIQISRLNPSTVGWGLLVVFIALFIRIIISFFAVSLGDLNIRERVFISLAWLPKATVQAAIGPVAFDAANSMANPRQDYQDLGLQILTIAVLVILITAPLGAVAIMLSAPKLLSQDDTKQNPEDLEASKEE